MRGQLRSSVLISRLLDYTSSKQISKQQSRLIQEKIITKIYEGSIAISEDVQNCNNYINQNVKENALNDIYESDDFNNYERDLKIMSCLNRSSLRLITPIKMGDRRKMIKQQQLQNKKKQDQEIKQNFMMRMKQWQAQKIKIQKRKKKQAQKKKFIQLNSEQKKKKQEKEVKQFMILFKKKSIENKIKEIQQRKIQRSRQLYSLSESEENLEQKEAYRYIEYNKKFMGEQQRRKQQVKKRLEDRSRSLQLNINQIVQHQKAFIQRIKQRLKIQSSNNSNIIQNSSTEKIIQSFNINKKDPEQRKKIEEKIKRIKEMQNKIRLIPLKISVQKKKEIQIIGDKLKNKKKYIFLSQKALRDSQIYQEFKDFDINIDKKDIGNHYLEQFKQKNRKLNAGKVHSQKILPVNKPFYKDYIKQIRENNKNILNPDEFGSIANKIKKGQNKIQAKKFLHEKSLHFEQKALQKIHELKSMDNYHDAVKKQGEIDHNYAKAIHAKLALAKIQ